jgi:CDP-ribitol ribitolphosphotransferase / teichoic acid ribitol-phosphate polymerase
VERPRGSTLGRWKRRLAFVTLKVIDRLARLTTRRDPNRILFVGHYGTDLSGDMQAVLARMAELGVSRNHVIRTFPPLRRRTDRAWLRLPRELARAGTVVIEEDVLYMLPTDGMRIIQIWHASGALKTIGYSRIGKLAARSPWSRHYKYFTWAIVSGEHDVPLFAEAFGMPEERVLPLGHPRMDRFFDPAWRERARAATLEAFPMAKGRRVILFAPTWRPQGLARVYDLSVLDYGRLYELCQAIDAVFIIRLHPTVVHPVDIPAAYADRIVNGTTSVMDAPEQLCATDLLITDYSSIILEYALLGRPMLFFAPDLQAYRADRDVYMPYEEFVPGRIVETFDDMLEAIRGDDYQVEKVEPFARSQFAPYMDGGATDRAVELILGHPPGVRYHSAPANAPGEIGAPQPQQDTPSE